MFVNTAGKSLKVCGIRTAMKGVFMQEKFLSVNYVEKDLNISNTTSSEST